MPADRGSAERRLAVFFAVAAGGMFLAALYGAALVLRPTQAAFDDDFLSLLRNDAARLALAAICSLVALVTNRQSIRVGGFAVASVALAWCVIDVFDTTLSQAGGIYLIGVGFLCTVALVTCAAAIGWRSSQPVGDLPSSHAAE